MSPLPAGALLPTGPNLLSCRGKTGEVSSTFDAKALGRFRKSIGVYCNASDKPVYLSFRGEVTADPKNYTFTHPYQIGAIRLNKEEIEFDDANRGDKPTIELLIANTSDRVYTPVLMHLPPYLSAVATPDKLGRNRTGKIKVTLDTEKLPRLGVDHCFGIPVTVPRRQGG